MPETNPAILSLLEFIGCCFEKNELLDGALQRYSVYETRDLARAQFQRLESDAENLLGTSGELTEHEDGVVELEWPGSLRMLWRGLAVMVMVPVRLKEAYFSAEEIPSETWRAAGDDLSALFDTRRRQ